MFTFILIVDSQTKPENAGEFLESLGSVREESDGRYVVEADGGMHDGWIAITSNPTIADDYSPEELQEIKEKIGDPAFFLIEGRDDKINFANDFIVAFDSSPDALIDNDHGSVESIHRVRELILDGVDWLHAES